MENEYSINLPTKFWYGRKEWKGWYKRGESFPGQHDFRYTG